MLAVDLDSIEFAPLLERLLEEWPEQVHICYDTDGRNVFHHCAADGREVSLAIILHWLAGNYSRVSADSLVAAFGVPDGVSRMSPLHLIAAGGRLGMLLKVADAFTQFAGTSQRGLRLPDDFYRRPSPNGLTPLALAEKAGAWDVCSWLRVRDGSCSLEAGATAPSPACELEQEVTVSSENEEDEDDEAEEDEKDEETEVSEIEEPTEAVAGELSRLSVHAGMLPTESARRRLAAGLASVEGDQKRFVGALMARCTPLREAGDFLNLSADPVAACVSLVMGGGGGMPVIMSALEDICRLDLKAAFLHSD